MLRTLARSCTRFRHPTSRSSSRRARARAPAPALLSPLLVLLGIPRRGSTTMSWRSHGQDNTSLIDALKSNDIIKDGGVERAMRLVDRGHFSPSGGQAYHDSPQVIGYGATISAPHMHAFCLELLAGHLVPGARALDVGSGTGYLSAVMAQMVGPEGRVVGVEHIPQLVEMSLTNMRKDPDNGKLMDSGRVRLLEGDGYQGFVEGGPYNAIHVGAAAPHVPPALTEQLKPGGRLVIPVGEFEQGLMVIDKGGDGSLTQHEAMGVRYVPLTTRERQLAGM